MFVKKAYDFDDVLLIPQPSELTSRTQVNVETKLQLINKDYRDFNLPIMSAPMKGLGKGVVIGLGALGGLGFLHRFQDTLFRLQEIDEVNSFGVPFGISVGLSETDFFLFNKAIFLEKRWENLTAICIDVANGYNSRIGKFIAALDTDKRDDIALISGNVVCFGGTNSLYNWGASGIRVGVGPGFVCATRNNTGVGYPQISAIYECSFSDGTVIADGGIRNSGDAVKALAAGADFIMLGSLLAKTFESDHDGKFGGMASTEHMENSGVTIKSVEGVTTDVKKNIHLNKFLSEFVWNIKSGMVYVGASNLIELRTKAEFVETGKNTIAKRK